MRAAALFPILISTLVGSIADAGNRVVLLDDSPGADSLPALQVALANRHVDIATAAAPTGALLLERASVAARAAMSSGADAGVWIDDDATGTEVCVVSSDGRRLRHAPLPADMPPRVFAAIASSLLDELLSPPEPGFGVDVYVDVHSNPPATPPDAIPAPPPMRARPPQVAMVAPGWGPSSVPVLTAAAVEPDRANSNRMLVEIGASASPVSYGLEGEVLFPINPQWRAGVLGGVDQLFDGIDDVVFQTYAGQSMFHVGGELRYIGHGRTHFDVGVIAGATWVSQNSDEASGLAALRMSVTRDLAGSSVSLDLAPTVLVGLGYEKVIIPGAIVSLRWGLPI